MSCRNVWLSSTCLVLFCVALPGCGESGPERFDVSGTVTYQGEPIPAGTIQFIPDSSKGNSGPSGQATIKDGKFDTAVDGVGTVGGPHTVSIDAFDGNAQPAKGLPSGEPIFYGYQEEIDLPKEDTTIDIDVPQQREIPKGDVPAEERFGVEEA